MRPLPLLLALAACASDAATARFVGTYTQQTLTGQNTLRLLPDGRAEFVSTVSEGGAEPASFLFSGRFTVVGDTAFARIENGDGPETMRLMLRGDTLAEIDVPGGMRPFFVRQR